MQPQGIRTALFRFMRAAAAGRGGAGGAGGTPAGKLRSKWARILITADRTGTRHTTLFAECCKTPPPLSLLAVRNACMRVPGADTWGSYGASYTIEGKAGIPCVYAKVISVMPRACHLLLISLLLLLLSPG